MVKNCLPQVSHPLPEDQAMKNLFLVTFILTLALPLAATPAEQVGFSPAEYSRARIVEITKKRPEGNVPREMSETIVTVEILDGAHEGEKMNAVFGGDSDLPAELQYREGMTVFVGISPGAGRGDRSPVTIYDSDNTPAIIVMAVVFVIAIALVGRLKGVLSLLALVVTVSLLFLILIPATLKGLPSLPVSMGIAILSILITLPIIAGLRKKTAAAILGSAGGVLGAALLAILAGHFIHLSGIVTDEMLTVFFVAEHTIDVRGLALSGMIIAALGALMDVCMSIASSASELYQARPDMDRGGAFRALMNIGTDILGSMVNTLILAYVGSSLSMVLFIALRMQPGMPFWMVLNHAPVLSEIVRSLVGSLGMFMAIPLTAFFSVRIFNFSSKE
jgi:uncharacterized membrane protein